MISKKIIDSMFSLVLIIFSIWIIVESYELSLGNLQDPGPGFLSFFAGILLGILNLINLLINKDRKVPAFSGFKNFLKLFYTLVSMLITVLFFETLGYAISVALFMILLLKIVSKESWVKTLIVTGSTVLLSYFVFKILLKIQLPVGLFGF